MMPRDMDLIRELLLRFERNDVTVPLGRTRTEVGYHIKQMRDAGLIEATVEGRSYIQFHVQDITPSGHDLILAIKNDTHWNRIKGHFEKVSVPLSVEMIIQVSKQLTKQLLGL